MQSRNPSNHLKMAPTRCWTEYFTLSKLGKADTVSVDRLKPAHLEPATSVTTTTPPADPAIPTTAAAATPSTPTITKTTRFGRKVNYPKKLNLLRSRKSLGGGGGGGGGGEYCSVHIHSTATIMSHNLVHSLGKPHDYISHMHIYQLHSLILYHDFDKKLRH